MDGIGGAARFDRPFGIAWDPTGSFLIVVDEGGKLVRKVYESAAGYKVSTVAGNGADGADAIFTRPDQVIVGPSGKFAILSDENTLRMVTLTLLIMTPTRSELPFSILCSIYFIRLT